MTLFLLRNNNIHNINNYVDGNIYKSNNAKADYI